LFNILIEDARLLQAVVVSKNGVGMFRRQLFAVV